MNCEELDLIVLKTIISDRRFAIDFVSSCDEKIFSADLWKFVKLLSEYVKVYKEVPTKKVMVERAQGLKNDALVKYISDIWNLFDSVSVDVKEYPHHLQKLKTRFSSKLISDLKSNLESNYSDISKSVSNISNVVNTIKAVNQAKAYEQKSLKESLPDFRQNYKNKMENPEFGVGLKTGIAFFDFLTSGLKGQEMLLIAGPTGGGKSILLNHVGINLWLGNNTIDMTENFSEGCDIVYFSLEMPYMDCMERVLASIAKVPQLSIRDAKLTEEERARLAKVMKFIEKYPYEFTIVDLPRNATPETIEVIFNDIAAAKGRKPKAIVIDYLSLMEWDEPGMDDWLKQGKLSEAMSEFGRANNVNVITAVQMNSDSNKGQGESIGTHRLSRSKLIGHNANFILMIEKTAVEDPRFILHLVKSRRTALSKGNLYKKLDCCALLPEPETNLFDGNDDISGKL